MHPDDLGREPGDEADGSAVPVTTPKAAPGDLAAVLVADLSAHRTAGLRLEMARQPAVALAATVHALALPLLYAFGGSGTTSCLVLRATSEPLARHLREPGDSPAHAALEVEGLGWQQRLPAEPAALWAWCLAQPQEVLLALLAFVAGLSVNAVEAKEPGHAGSARRPGHADQLAEALALDMTRHWTPSVDGFYGRLTKANLTHIVTEAKAPCRSASGR